VSGALANAAQFGVADHHGLGDQQFANHVDHLFQLGGGDPRKAVAGAGGSLLLHRLINDLARDLAAFDQPVAQALVRLEVLGGLLDHVARHAHLGQEVTDARHLNRQIGGGGDRALAQAGNQTADLVNTHENALDESRVCRQGTVAHRQ